MNGTIGQMLTLTAEIAETLLTLKDANRDITPDLIDKIEQLHRLAQKSAIDTAVVPESVTVIPDERTSAREPENVVDTPKDEAPDQTSIAINETEETTEVKSKGDPDAPETYDSHTHDARMLREAMSLNDLFLFRRTLFGGSAERFNTALNAIAGMTRLSEVRDYMRNRSGINLKSPEAKDFISIIAPFFDED